VIVRGGNAADLRIVTVVTAIATANEVKGEMQNWRKTLPRLTMRGTRRGEYGTVFDLKVRYFRTRVCSAARSVFAGN